MDISIDLETLNLVPSSHILAIGAARFDLVTGIVSDTFERTVEMINQDDRTVDMSTIKFWLGQSDEARRALISESTVSLEQALRDFAMFVQEDDVVWGNGATFDISIMEHAYNYKAPWKYFNVNDMRTIVRVAECIKGFNKRDVQFVGEPHKALDDAVHQAKVIHLAYKSLRG